MSVWPLCWVEPKSFSLLAVDRVVVIYVVEHAVLDPCLDDLAASGFGAVGTMAQDDRPSGPVWRSGCVRVALPVGHAGVDIGQGGVEMLVGQPGPCLGRLPRHNGLNLITGRVLRGAVAESDPDKLEPCRVLRRRAMLTLLLSRRT